MKENVKKKEKPTRKLTADTRAPGFWRAIAFLDARGPQNSGRQ